MNLKDQLFLCAAGMCPSVRIQALMPPRVIGAMEAPSFARLLPVPAAPHRLLGGTSLARPRHPASSNSRMTHRCRDKLRRRRVEAGRQRDCAWRHAARARPAVCFGLLCVEHRRTTIFSLGCMENHPFRTRFSTAALVLPCRRRKQLAFLMVETHTWPASNRGEKCLTYS